MFITNVVKCRPPDNRDPEPDEIAACAPFLRRQLEVLDPALIVTLGRHSMGRFMPGARIGQVHGTTKAGRPRDRRARGADVFAMYHPAAALHQGSLRQTLLDDMARVPGALVDGARATSEPADSEPSPARRGAPAHAPPPAADDRPTAARRRPDVDPAHLRPTPTRSPRRPPIF